MRVRTSFTPLRMVAGQKRPVVLAIEVFNKTRDMRNYSVSVKLPFVFSFGPGILLKEKRIRIGKVEPGKSKDALFKVYGKYNIVVGNYPVGIVVKEHGERFDQAIGEMKLPTSLRVVQ